MNFISSAREANLVVKERLAEDRMSRLFFGLSLLLFLFYFQPGFSKRLIVKQALIVADLLPYFLSEPLD